MLFTFLAQRYERKSVVIAGNLVFGEWDRIFDDPMTTAAAIDRLVHHATILEMAGRSVPAEEAAASTSAGHKRRMKATAPYPTATTNNNGTTTTTKTNAATTESTTTGAMEVSSIGEWRCRQAANSMPIDINVAKNFIESPLHNSAKLASTPTSRTNTFQSGAHTTRTFSCIRAGRAST